MPTNRRNAVTWPRHTSPSDFRSASDLRSDSLLRWMLDLISLRSAFPTLTAWFTSSEIRTSSVRKCVKMDRLSACFFSSSVLKRIKTFKTNKRIKHERLMPHNTRTRIQAYIPVTTWAPVRQKRRCTNAAYNMWPVRQENLILYTNLAKAFRHETMTMLQKINLPCQTRRPTQNTPWADDRRTSADLELLLVCVTGQRCKFKNLSAENTKPSRFKSTF